MRWFFPSWNGDHRLIADGKNSSILEVEAPTAAEVEKLEKFLKKAKKKGWIDEVPAVESQEYELAASIEVAGAALADVLRAKKGRITAVRYKEGVVVLKQETDLDLSKKPEAVVTTKRGTMSCPKPLPVNERASEALMAFLDDEQTEQWEAERRIVAYGGYTGTCYVIGHRGGEFARRNRFICRSIDDNAPVHCYDWSVPPEEEVLGMKLILEHHEDWIRNPSGCFVRAGGVKFRNPLGDDYMDGTKDTAFLSGLGEGFLDGAQAVKNLLFDDKD